MKLFVFLGNLSSILILMTHKLINDSKNINLRADIF
jgi:hypothetical protein